MPIAVLPELASSPYRGTHSGFARVGLRQISRYRGKRGNKRRWFPSRLLSRGEDATRARARYPDPHIRVACHGVALIFDIPVACPLACAALLSESHIAILRAQNVHIAIRRRRPRTSHGSGVWTSGQVWVVGGRRRSGEGLRGCGVSPVRVCV